MKEIKYGGITSPEGFTAGAVYVGVKSRKKEKPDVALLVSDRPATCAAMFTTNRMCGAPIILGQRIARLGTTRGVVLNSGNANTATGQAGIHAALSVERDAEKLLGFEEDSLFVSSTGVIGEAFPADKVKAGVEQIIPRLSKTGGHEAARAIMTTDRFIKEYACELSLSVGKVRIGLMAKGSGMVHPNMATILCFITTDACMQAKAMQSMLKRATAVSFNTLSVDGDTSTNDTLIMMANGATGISPSSDKDLRIFEDAITEILSNIARLIVFDGEGASKTMKIRVSGAPDDQEARRIARCVASSDGIKTALGHGSVPESFVLAIAGAAESTADFSTVSCHVQNNYDTTIIDISFKDGNGRAEAYGCDLNDEYIRLNAFYRT